MNRKALVLIIGIVTAIFAIGISDLLALGIWLYLVWKVWNKKANMFNNQVEAATAKKLLKRLKILLLIAGIAFAAFIFWAVRHNVQPGVPEAEKTVSLVIALVAHVVFVVATAAGLAEFLEGRRRAT